jgi:hypothetical protein
VIDRTQRVLGLVYGVSWANFQRAQFDSPLIFDVEAVLAPQTWVSLNPFFTAPRFLLKGYEFECDSSAGAAHLFLAYVGPGAATAVRKMRFYVPGSTAAVGFYGKDLTIAFDLGVKNTTTDIGFFNPEAGGGPNVAVRGQVWGAFPAT